MFVLSMQGLTAMLDAAIDANLIYLPSAGGVTVSHLIFADDLVIFADDTAENAACIRSIMKCFACFLGINKNGAKSHLITSRSADESALSDVLGIPRAALPMRYLGLPLFAGRLTKAHCQPLINKFAKKLDSWNTRLLSMAGRIELVISTLSSCSIFWTAVFPLPATDSEEIDKMCRKFIRGDTLDSKKPHLISWDTICKPQKEGGLGIRSSKE